MGFFWRRSRRWANCSTFWNGENVPRAWLVNLLDDLLRQKQVHRQYIEGSKEYLLVTHPPKHVSDGRASEDP